MESLKFTIGRRDCCVIEVDNAIVYVIKSGFKEESYYFVSLSPGCYDEDIDHLTVDEIKERCGDEIWKAIDEFFNKGD